MVTGWLVWIFCIFTPDEEVRKPEPSVLFTKHVFKKAGLPLKDRHVFRVTYFELCGHFFDLGFMEKLTSVFLISSIEILDIASLLTPITLRSLSQCLILVLEKLKQLPLSNSTIHVLILEDHFRCISVLRDPVDFQLPVLTNTFTYEFHSFLIHLNGHFAGPCNTRPVNI